MSDTGPALVDVYRDAYLSIRAKYGHPDPPIQVRPHYTYCEALPPKQWNQATYAAYFDEVMRLARWYRAAREYACIKRKRPEDRATYLAVCDREAVAGHGMRFAGEPEPALF
jgi:hypothetical protein